MYQLFIDEERCTQFLKEYEDEFMFDVGDQGIVSLSTRVTMFPVVY